MRNKIFRAMLYVLPAVLYFSYYPVISFGSDGATNFEFNLPMIWLVLFDLFAFVLILKKKLLGKIFKNWQLLLFPIYLTLTLAWSANRVRGLLVVGLVWLIYFAGYAFYLLKEEYCDKKFWQNFKKVFIGSSVAVVVWLLVQCILDLLQVPRECSLLCLGCTSASFGFPHPNGFAIEPQFMGNLLLAPVIYFAVTLFRDKCEHKKLDVFLLFFFMCAVFLTFSRGAIYAMGVALIFFTVMKIVQMKNKRVLLIWPIMILAFVFTLNLQGIFASLSPTDDTYYTGVAKVLNHLSLGIIDIRDKSESGNTSGISADGNVADEPVIVNDEPRDVSTIYEAESAEVSETSSTFDGYVPESTEIRMKMTEAALATWSKDAKTILIGAGIGGAGQAMYDAGKSDWPKEIVQNEYASLLLETGIVGIILLIYSGVLILKKLKSANNNDMILTLIFGYGVTLLFFAGLPNALHMYLLPSIAAYGKS